MSRPLDGDFGEFYKRYILLAAGESPKALIALHSSFISDYICHLPDAAGDYAYDTGKWTVKQLLQHMMDTERIFVYRLLCIARGDLRPLSGFDENAFATAAPANNRKLQDIKEEILALRKSTDILIASLSEQELKQKGEASGYAVTANALCFMIFGHSLHHIQIMKEKYTLA
jgi:uncharacterized damage-inducible protein DinB